MKWVDKPQSHAHQQAERDVVTVEYVVAITRSKSRTLFVRMLHKRVLRSRQGSHRLFHILEVSCHVQEFHFLSFCYCCLSGDGELRKVIVNRDIIVWIVWRNEAVFLQSVLDGQKTKYRVSYHLLSALLNPNAHIYHI